MIKFKDDPALGKTVKKTTAWCFGYEPINDMWSLRFAAGGNKFSQLCTFKFESVLPDVEYPTFSIAFVAKLRSKFYHQSKNMSQWFIFKKISPTRTDVLSKEQLLINYGFDIDKFFQSDMFTAMLAKFKEYIKHGLDVEIPKFKASLSEVTKKKEADKFANAITEALGMIGSTAVNNKYYKLLLNPDLEESNDDVVLDSKIEEELEKRGLYVDIKDDHIEEAMNEADDKIDEQYDYEATCVEFAKHIVPSLLNSTSLKALADADGNSENAIAWVVCSLAEHLKATAKDVELKKLGEKVSEACMEVML